MAARFLLPLGCATAAIIAPPFIAAAAGQTLSPTENPATWFGPDQYPIEAMQARQEGRVAFELTIDGAGRPTKCRIVQSSKSSSLDKTTCKIAMAKARFAPDATTSARTWAGAIRWALGAGALATNELRFKAAANGELQCFVTMGGKSVALKTDVCNMFAEPLRRMGLDPVITPSFVGVTDDMIEPVAPNPRPIDR